ncbi:hypothetical protein D3C80_403630 [compost metagenome]
MEVGRMEVTRAGLYELVGSQPMSQLAKSYGVAAVKIARACDDYHIARPPAGYWQKFAHGKAPGKSVLQCVAYSAAEIVTIECLAEARSELAREMGIT